MQKQPPEVFYIKKVFLKISAKFTAESNCARVSFLIKLQTEACKFIKKERPRPATLLKKRFRHRCFPANFGKFLKSFITGHLRATASKDVQHINLLFFVLTLNMYFVIGRELLHKAKYLPFYKTYPSFILDYFELCANNIVNMDANFTWDLYTFIFPDDIISSTSS